MQLQWPSSFIERGILYLYIIYYEHRYELGVFGVLGGTMSYIQLVAAADQRQSLDDDATNREHIKRNR